MFFHNLGFNCFCKTLLAVRKDWKLQYIYFHSLIHKSWKKCPSCFSVDIFWENANSGLNVSSHFFMVFSHLLCLQRNWKTFMGQQTPLISQSESRFYNSDLWLASSNSQLINQRTSLVIFISDWWPEGHNQPIRKQCL